MESDNWDTRNLAGLTLRTINFDLKELPITPIILNTGSRFLTNNLELAFVDVQPAAFGTIVNDIATKCGITNTLEAVEIIYYGSIKIPDLTPNNSKAIQILYKGTNSYVNKFYKRNSSGTMILDQVLAVNTNDYSIDDIMALANYVLPGNPTIRAINFSKYQYAPLTNILPVNTQNLTKARIFNRIIPVESVCNKTCNKADEYKNCARSIFNPSLTCRDDNSGGLCNMRTLKDSSTKYNLPSAFIDNTFAYDIRDNFMSNSSVLTKYKKYFYRISEFEQAFNVISFSNLSSHLNLAQETFAVLNRLKNGAGTQVVFDNNYKTTVINFLNLYKSQTTDPDYIALFNDIQNDANLYVNKTKDQLTALIQ